MSESGSRSHLFTILAMIQTLKVQSPLPMHPIESTVTDIASFKLSVSFMTLSPLKWTSCTMIQIKAMLTTHSQN